MLGRATKVHELYPIHPGMRIRRAYQDAEAQSARDENLCALLLLTLAISTLKPAELSEFVRQAIPPSELNHPPQHFNPAGTFDPSGAPGYYQAPAVHQDPAQPIDPYPTEWNPDGFLSFPNEFPETSPAQPTHTGPNTAFTMTLADQFQPFSNPEGYNYLQGYDANGQVLVSDVAACCRALGTGDCCPRTKRYIEFWRRTWPGPQCDTAPGSRWRVHPRTGSIVQCLHRSVYYAEHESTAILLHANFTYYTYPRLRPGRTGSDQCAAEGKRRQVLQTTPADIASPLNTSRNDRVTHARHTPLTAAELDCGPEISQPLWPATAEPGDVVRRAKCQRTRKQADAHYEPY